MKTGSFPSVIGARKAALERLDFFTQMVREEKVEIAPSSQEKKPSHRPISTKAPKKR